MNEFIKEMKKSLLENSISNDNESKIRIQIKAKDLAHLILSIEMLKEENQQLKDFKKLVTDIKYSKDEIPLLYLENDLSPIIDATLGYYERKLREVLNVDSQAVDYYDSDGSLDEAIGYNIHSILEVAGVIDSETGKFKVQTTAPIPVEAKK